MAEMFLRQELKLQQKLVMTQELQLAIKLLQMNRMEITTEIQQQLMDDMTLIPSSEHTNKLSQKHNYCESPRAA